jgi:hypothetical protein
MLFLFVRMTVTFVANNRVIETLGITVKLNIASEATNFVTQILGLFAYGTSGVL